MPNITVSSFQIEGYHYGGTTAKLRLYADRAWTDFAGTPHLQGAVGSPTGFYQEIPCTVSGTTLIVPTFITQSTQDAVDDPNVLITGVIFDYTDARRDNLFTGWFIPTAPTPIIWENLLIDNLTHGFLQPSSTYPTLSQIQTIISAQTQGFVETVPSGVVNGINQTFILPSTPVPGTLLFFVAGILQTQVASPGEIGTQTFSLSGTTITSWLPPQSGDAILAVYLTNSGLIANGFIPTQIHETSGPTNLNIGAIPATPPRQLLVRDGTNIVGVPFIGKVVHANEYPGSDVAAKVNAAMAALGSDAGTVLYYGGGAINSGSIIVTSNHHLHLGAGTYTNTLAGGGAIRMESDTMLSGDGWSTIIEESSAPFTDGQSLVVIVNSGAFVANGAVQRNMIVRDLQLRGAAPFFFSAPQSIELGNCHGGLVENVYCNSMHTISMQAGGSSTLGPDPLGLGRFSENVTFRNNLFYKCVSQNMAFVNTKNSTMAYNRIIDPGQGGGPGSTPIDCEVNDAFNDLMDNISIIGNYMDSRHSVQFPHGNFIAFQPANASKGFIIANNYMTSYLQGDPGYHVSNGIIMTTGNEGLITGNFFNGCGQCGMFLAGTRLTVTNNKFINCGTSGFPTIQLADVTESEVLNNTSHETLNGNGSILETGSSNNNVFYGNNLVGYSAGIGIIGAGSVIGENTYNRVTFTGAKSFLGSTSGATKLQAAAVAGATTLTLPAITDTLVSRTNTEQLSNKTLVGPQVGASGTILTQVKVYTPSLTPASVNANTTAEQDFTVTGLTTADKVIVNGPAPTAGTGIVGVRVKALNTLSITFSNNTAGSLTPAAGTYNIVAITT